MFDVCLLVSCLGLGVVVCVFLCWVVVDVVVELFGFVGLFCFAFWVGCFLIGYARLMFVCL